MAAAFAIPLRKGSVRNARVLAERNTDLLLLPKQVYLQYWYNLYTLNDFGHLFDNGDGSILNRRHRLMSIAVQKKQMNKHRCPRYVPLTLQLSTLFQKPEQVKLFANFLEELDLLKGHCLFQQGESVNAFYFVEMGQINLLVEQYGGQVKAVQTCGAGELLGDVDFYTQTVYPTAAVATQNSQVYRLNRTALQQMQQDYPQVAITFNEMVLTRIANCLATFNDRQGDAITPA